MSDPKRRRLSPLSSDHVQDITHSPADGAKIAGESLAQFRLQLVCYVLLNPKSWRALFEQYDFPFFCRDDICRDDTVESVLSRPKSDSAMQKIELVSRFFLEGIPSKTITVQPRKGPFSFRFSSQEQRELTLPRVSGPDVMRKHLRYNMAEFKKLGQSIPFLRGDEEFVSKSREYCVAGLIELFVKGTMPHLRQREEREVLKDIDINRLEFQLCSIQIPTDVMRYVFSFLEYNYSLMFGKLALLGENYYALILSSWASTVRIANLRDRMFEIPALVWQSMRSVTMPNPASFRLCKGKRFLVFALSNLSRKFLREIQFEPLPRYFYTDTEACKSVRHFLRYWREGKSGQLGNFQGLQTVKFLPLPSNSYRVFYEEGRQRKQAETVDIDVTFADFRLVEFGPSITSVIHPPTLSICEGMTRIRELRLFNQASQPDSILSSLKQPYWRNIERIELGDWISGLAEFLLIHSLLELRLRYLSRQGFQDLRANFASQIEPTMLENLSLCFQENCAEIGSIPGEFPRLQQCRVSGRVPRSMVEFVVTLENLNRASILGSWSSSLSELLETNNHLFDPIFTQMSQGKMIHFGLALNHQDRLWIKKIRGCIKVIVTVSKHLDKPTNRWLFDDVLSFFPSLGSFRVQGDVPTMVLTKVNVLATFKEIKQIRLSSFQTSSCPLHQALLSGNRSILDSILSQVPRLDVFSFTSGAAGLRLFVLEGGKKNRISFHPKFFSVQSPPTSRPTTTILAWILEKIAAFWPSSMSEMRISNERPWCHDYVTDSRILDLVDGWTEKYEIVRFHKNDSGAIMTWEF